MCNHDLRTSPPPLHASALNVHVAVNDGHRVVNVSGELDMASCHLVEQACLADADVAVVVEMAELTFMDCAGYAGLVTARRLLQAHGGSLTWSHQAGQPARLLSLLGAVEYAPRAADLPG